MHRSPRHLHRSLTTPAAITPSNFVRVVEVGPRDGLQNEPGLVPTPLKVELLHRLSKTGLRTIEATSFVNKKIIPQLADSAEVLSALGLKSGKQSLVPGYIPSPINYPVLVPNSHFLAEAIQSGAKEIAIFGSCSESFSQKNINCSIEQSLNRFKKICDIAKIEGIKVRGYLSCVIACPYDGPTPPTRVLNLVQELLRFGCYEISLGDTIGVGTPFSVRALLRTIMQAGVPPNAIAGHYHDTYGQALANVLASLDFGVRVFDSSIAGLGGCPFARGATGNLATEDLLYMLQHSGFETGVDLHATVQIGEWISRELGRQNGSRTGTAIMRRMQRQSIGGLGSSPKI